MTAPVYLILSADSGVAALCGTRIYPAGIIPQEVVTFPTVVFQTVTGTAENIQSGNAPADYERIQIDCWDVSMAGADAMFAAVRTALENLPTIKALGCAAVLSNFNGDSYESDTKRYKNSTDWDFYLLR